jgi:hypothetical protein
LNSGLASQREKFGCVFARTGGFFESGKHSGNLFHPI